MRRIVVHGLGDVRSAVGQHRAIVRQQPVLPVRRSERHHVRFIEARFDHALRQQQPVSRMLRQPRGGVPAFALVVISPIAEVHRGPVPLQQELLLPAGERERFARLERARRRIDDGLSRTACVDPRIDE